MPTQKAPSEVKENDMNGYYSSYGSMVEGNVPEVDYLAEYDNYINRREREHYDSLEYGSDDESVPAAFDWQAIHDMVDWRSQTYFS